MPLVKVVKPSNKLFDRLIKKPYQLIILSFIIVILAGTVLLSLPFASDAGHWTSPFKALFTATSATCVTGLVLVDTATYWSLFGQIVIICLIQIGGLGLATITSFFISFASGRQHNWRLRDLAQETTAMSSKTEVWNLVRFIIILTLSLESLGALLLMFQFIPVYGHAGIWKAVFQSISAFCNAGFDLHGSGTKGPYSSLTAFAHSPTVLLITAFLIIAGGLGFIVWYDVLRSRKTRKLQYHTRLVLILTVFLLLLGTLVFAFLEWNNTASADAMGRLTYSERPLAAFFQSVTTRTAGFNSIDQAKLTPASKFISALLMFVGAAPAGTGGGIKITTFIVFLSVIVASMRNQEQITTRKHKISRSLVIRATAIFGLGLIVVSGAVTLIAIFENQSLMANRFKFIDLIYETISAFGTVGLSSLGTYNLTSASHVVLILCMFIGRIGPAAFALYLVPKEQFMEQVKPEGKTLIG